MAWLEPLTLVGKRCSLAPLSDNHHDELVTAVRDGNLWDLWYTLIPSPEKMSSEITRRLRLQAEKSMLPFTIICNASNKAIGMTTFLNADEKNKRVEIGGTWLCKTMQKTGINTEAKKLLLAHAFETLNCQATEFRTHYCNHQSRQGIERLGAKLDGILRSHMIMPDGTLRDTCVYSILLHEWPTIRNHLNHLSKKQP
jgi:RimJ/RimL family protein N-acetyltransferase